MIQFNEKYVVDDRGERIGVILDIGEYEKILEELEELDSLRAYDEAKSTKDEVIPFDQATREIEQERR